MSAQVLAQRVLKGFNHSVKLREDVLEKLRLAYSATMTAYETLDALHLLEDTKMKILNESFEIWEKIDIAEEQLNIATKRRDDYIARSTNQNIDESSNTDNIQTHNPIIATSTHPETEKNINGKRIIINKNNECTETKKPKHYTIENDGFEVIEQPSSITPTNRKNMEDSKTTPTNQSILKDSKTPRLE